METNRKSKEKKTRVKAGRLWSEAFANQQKCRGYRGMMKDLELRAAQVRRELIQKSIDPLRGRRGLGSVVTEQTFKEVAQIYSSCDVIRQRAPDDCATFQQAPRTERWLKAVAKNARVMSGR